jgi:thioredoxin-related protein
MKMKRIALILLPIAFITLAAFTYFKPTPKPAEAGGIKWMTWEQVEKAQKVQPRKVYVDIYTDWCGWCKRMDATTFTNPEIINYINNNYYAVKFDAETKENIKLNGKEYKFVPSGSRGYNELAAEIMRGQMSYPTTVYMNENLEVIFPVPGYMSAQDLERVIHYVNTNSYKEVSWEQYQQTFVGKIK